MTNTNYYVDIAPGRPELFQNRSAADKTVPCNGCTLCCRNDAVILMEWEDASLYRTEPHHRFEGRLMLAHQPGGACIYLTDAGCLIHATRPFQCRQFDCRDLYRKVRNGKVARRLHDRHLISIDTWRRGRELTRRKL